MFIERRQSERDDIELDAVYSVKGLFKTEDFPCLITDVSKDGVGIQCESESGPLGIHPRGGLKNGTSLHLKVKDLDLPCKVIYTEMSNVGLSFDHVSESDAAKLKAYVTPE